MTLIERLLKLDPIRYMVYMICAWVFSMVTIGFSVTVTGSDRQALLVLGFGSMGVGLVIGVTLLSLARIYDKRSKSNLNHCIALHPSGVTLTQVIWGCSS